MIAVVNPGFTSDRKQLIQHLRLPRWRYTGPGPLRAFFQTGRLCFERQNEVNRRLGALRSPACVFKAWRNLSGPMWFQNQNQTPERSRAASRWSAPGLGQRTRRKDRAPAHRPQMSSSRLFLDRVATRARLRFAGICTITRVSQRPGQKGTFLLCHRGDISTLPGRGTFLLCRDTAWAPLDQARNPLIESRPKRGCFPSCDKRGL
jgi:hypothetical protein